MPLYNQDKEPVWQWTSSSIQTSIVFDLPTTSVYTNLDEISGKVLLRCAKAINITSIIVKLEGESRTRLVGQLPDARDRDPKPSLEYHKVSKYRESAVK